MTARPQTGGPCFWAVFTVAATAGLLCLPPIAAALVSTLAALGLVSLTDDQRIAKANRIRKALSICQISMTTAALEMKWDYREFERAMAGERKLDDWRLEMLGDEFQRVLAAVTLVELGPPALVRCYLKMQPVLEAIKESA